MIGQSFGRYHILEQLGQGGMATVYKAFDTRLEREVAVKFIRGEKLTGKNAETVFRRFKREAQALAKLSHPNILTVLDYGEHEGQLYLVTEYLPGGSLKQKLGKPIPWAEAATLLAPIARALEYAHSQHILHRDVKPANILLSPSGLPVLADFGIAKLLESDETTELTRADVGIGTPEYMAPEQGRGRADLRSDIYSLGVVLYELVTGRKPYTADTPVAVLVMHASEPLPRPKSFVRNLPDSVEKVIVKALAKRPEDRYQSMSYFAAALERAPQGDKVPAWWRLALPASGVAAVLLAVIGVVLGGMGALLFSTFFQTRPESVPAFAITPTAPNQLSLSSGRTTGTAADVPSPIATSTEEAPIETELIEIPAGPFIMGSVDGDVLQAESLCLEVDLPSCSISLFTNEQPRRIATLDRYYMQVTEVTNRQYRQCVAAGACDPPAQIDLSALTNYFQSSDYDNYPAVYVEWSYADRYCKWLGEETGKDYRLPTEAEWEKAARGEHGNIWPWGDTRPDGTRANLCDASCALQWRDTSISDGYIYTSPVGIFPAGRSPYGVLDMAGNVWEWVADWYDATYYSYAPDDNPTGPESGNRRVIRGSGWNHGAYYARTANRGDVATDTATSRSGFRCVANTR